MNREVMQRVGARVLPVNAAGEALLPHGWDPAALEGGSIDDARWWTADALEVDDTAVSETLLTMMRAAVGAVLR